MKQQHIYKTFILAILALCLYSTSAYAYIGPGAGITAIGTVIALIGAILLAIVGFVWYPVKRMLKKNKSDEKKENEDKNESDSKS